MGTRNRFNVCHPCCTGTPPPCTGCSVDPGDTVPVTFSGFTDAGFCKCGTWFNATFVLTRDSLNPCYWRASGYWGCKSTYIYSYGSYYEIKLNLTIDPVSGNYIWLCTLYIGGWLYAYQWNSGTSSPIDCTATRTLALAYYMNWTGVVYCANYLSSSCQVN